MARFYREWGRIGQGGQVRMDWFADEAQAIAALIKLEAAKRRRGYRVEP
jgi:predicted DNA-binding WGR domain protein